ncbi:uncharacterized protein LOC142324237 isoform X1 [Lycorma delicatula]|uniref:uncharacterized protein LOC142324237 isoform X1 n=2 Tax=Lycorma delicatula TaxID=130591 RepID=UPI003F513C3E
MRLTTLFLNKAVAAMALIRQSCKLFQAYNMDRRYSVESELESDFEDWTRRIFTADDVSVYDSHIDKIEYYHSTNFKSIVYDYNHSPVGDYYSDIDTFSNITKFNKYSSDSKHSTCNVVNDRNLKKKRDEAVNFEHKSANQKISEDNFYPDMFSFNYFTSLNTTDQRYNFSKHKSNYFSTDNISYILNNDQRNLSLNRKEVKKKLVGSSSIFSSNNRDLLKRQSSLDNKKVGSKRKTFETSEINLNDNYNKDKHNEILIRPLLPKISVNNPRKRKFDSLQDQNLLSKSKTNELEMDCNPRKRKFDSLQDQNRLSKSKTNELKMDCKNKSNSDKNNRKESVIKVLKDIPTSAAFNICKSNVLCNKNNLESKMHNEIKKQSVTDSVQTKKSIFSVNNEKQCVYKLKQIEIPCKSYTKSIGCLQKSNNKDPRGRFTCSFRKNTSTALDNEKKVNDAHGPRVLAKKVDRNVKVTTGNNLTSHKSNSPVSPVNKIRNSVTQNTVSCIKKQGKENNKVSSIKEKLLMDGKRLRVLLPKHKPAEENINCSSVQNLQKKESGSEKRLEVKQENKSPVKKKFVINNGPKKKINSSLTSVYKNSSSNNKKSNTVECKVVKKFGTDNNVEIIRSDSKKLISSEKMPIKIVVSIDRKLIDPDILKIKSDLTDNDVESTDNNNSNENEKLTSIQDDVEYQLACLNGGGNYLSNQLNKCPIDENNVILENKSNNFKSIEVQTDLHLNEINIDGLPLQLQSSTATSEKVDVTKTLGTDGNKNNDVNKNDAVVITNKDSYNSNESSSSSSNNNNLFSIIGDNINVDESIKSDQNNFKSCVLDKINDEVVKRNVQSPVTETFEEDIDENLNDSIQSPIMEMSETDDGNITDTVQSPIPEINEIIDESEKICFQPPVVGFSVTNDQKDVEDCIQSPVTEISSSSSEVEIDSNNMKSSIQSAVAENSEINNEKVKNSIHSSCTEIIEVIENIKSTEGNVIIVMNIKNGIPSSTEISEINENNNIKSCIQSSGGKISDCENVKVCGEEENRNKCDIRNICDTDPPIEIIDLSADLDDDIYVEEIIDDDLKITDIKENSSKLSKKVTFKNPIDDRSIKKIKVRPNSELFYPNNIVDNGFDESIYSLFKFLADTYYQFAFSAKSIESTGAYINGVQSCCHSVIAKRRMLEVPMLCVIRMQEALKAVHRLSYLLNFPINEENLKKHVVKPVFKIASEKCEKVTEEKILLFITKDICNMAGRKNFIKSVKFVAHKNVKNNNSFTVKNRNNVSCGGNEIISGNTIQSDNAETNSHSYNNFPKENTSFSSCINTAGNNYQTYSDLRIEHQQQVNSNIQNIVTRPSHNIQHILPPAPKPLMPFTPFHPPPVVTVSKIACGTLSASSVPVANPFPSVPSIVGSAAINPTFQITNQSLNTIQQIACKENVCCNMCSHDPLLNSLASKNSVSDALIQQNIVNQTIRMPVISKTIQQSSEQLQMHMYPQNVHPVNACTSSSNVIIDMQSDVLQQSPVNVNLNTPPIPRTRCYKPRITATTVFPPIITSKNCNSENRKRKRNYVSKKSTVITGPNHQIFSETNSDSGDNNRNAQIIINNEHSVDKQLPSMENSKRTEQMNGFSNYNQAIDAFECEVCRSTATLMCSKCCSTAYCSEICATKDWNNVHFQFCQKLETFKENLQNQ